MNKDKKIDIMTRKNDRLLNQLEECKLKLDLEKQEGGQKIENFKEIIDNLDGLQIEWQEAIADIRKYQAQYKTLINELVNS